MCPVPVTSSSSSSFSSSGLTLPLFLFLLLLCSPPVLLASSAPPTSQFSALRSAFDFLTSYARDNGPKARNDKLNASCKDFYRLPAVHLKPLEQYIKKDVLNEQLNNSTRVVRYLLKLWSLVYSTEEQLPKICQAVLAADPRLALCLTWVIRRRDQVCVSTMQARAGRLDPLPCNKSTVNVLIEKFAKSIQGGEKFPNKWSKAPVFFCAKNNSTERRWLVRRFFPLMEPVNAKKNSKSAINGFMELLYPLDGFRVDQCEDKKKIPTHQCSETTKCVYRQQAGAPPFFLGNYFCQCQSGYYRTTSIQGFNGSDLEEAARRRYATGSGTAAAAGEHCILCIDQRCSNCGPETRCISRLNRRLMKDFPLGVQSFCITVCVVVMAIIFKIRRKRVIKASGWILIEIFLFGAVLLYASVVVMYFEPQRITCFLIPWLREVGFSVTYGTLIVKVYKVLSGFQSRKAHRVCVRDKDVLRYILVIFIAVVAYMGAWTAVNTDHLKSNSNSSMLQDSTTKLGQDFSVCRAGIWDVVAEVSEFLFLCWGLYYCHCVRSAPSEYSELRFITAALIMEIVVSATLHIARHFVWLTLDPNYMYLLYFLRCHLTVTITVILIIGPKLWFLHHPPSTQFGRSRALSHAESHLVQPIKLNLTSNGDIDLGEINIADMDPEDIRRELKRLYTHMELYKLKEMQRGNPHISRRKGGRKQTHRRFSLQPFHHKHRSHHTSASVHEEEVSKVSDGSNNSGDEGAERKTTT